MPKTISWLVNIVFFFPFATSSSELKIVITLLLTTIAKSEEMHDIVRVSCCVDILMKQIITTTHASVTQLSK